MENWHVLFGSSIAPLGMESFGVASRKTQIGTRFRAPLWLKFGQWWSYEKRAQILKNIVSWEIGVKTCYELKVFIA